MDQEIELAEPNLISLAPEEAAEAVRLLAALIRAIPTPASDSSVSPSGSISPDDPSPSGSAPAGGGESDPSREASRARLTVGPRSPHADPSARRAIMMFTLGNGLEKAEAMADPEGFADTFVFLYREIHDQLLEEVSGLSEQALSWVPGPDTSSISALVVHLLGSETEVLKIVRGLPSDRDRASEFSARVGDPEELVGRIRATDRLLKELGPQITDEDLATLRVRPSAVRNRTPRTGLFWLLNSYGHAREHLAQLQLTKQLFHETHQSDLLDG